MTPSRRPPPLTPFLAASLCSGAAALLNQVMWSRMLSLVFGSTIEAVAAVTAVFMAGLALGSALGPRLVRNRDSISGASVYSKIEFAIGAFALALAFLVPALESVRSAVGILPTWLAAVVLLLVPTALMGTTLVVQSHVVSMGHDLARSSRTAGLLFAANTFGAVAGAYGSVLYLAPHLGVSRTIFVACVLNAVAGLLAMPWARVPREGGNDIQTPAEAVAGSLRGGSKGKSRGKADVVAPVGSVAAPPPALTMVMVALFAAGFVGLVNEVAWTRAFILVAGPTVHAFAFVLGAIVLGLASGALVSSALLPLLSNPVLAFAMVQAAVSAASAWVISALASMPLAYGQEVRRLVDRPEELIRLQGERALLLLFPVAALSGALFPLGVRLLRARLPVSQAMGRASALNTTGAILGALLAGFVLLPDLGLDRTLRFAAVVAGGSALLIALQCRRHSRIAALLLATAALALGLRAPRLDRELFAGGAYKYSAYDPNLSVEDVLRRGELVSYAEGRVANVSVKRVGSSFSLAVDGKVDATSGGDMLTQRLLAHIPFLISKSPRRALVIGLGSGVTAAAALSHGPDSVTAVEISSDVVEAARRYFAEANGHALDNPKLTLVTGDARQQVFFTRDRYDVIISEPSNPWMAGVSALFTREFFDGVKARLAPGGVFCQWGHLYNMAPDDLRTLLATFRDVFPRSRVYVISEADILIVGGDHPPDLSSQRLTAMTPAALRDLEASDLSPALVSAIPTVLLSDLDGWLKDARRHTDDRPVLDFRAPLSIHAQTSAENRLHLLGAESPRDPALVRSRLALLKASGSQEWLFELASKALSHGLDDPSIAREFVESAVRLHRVDQAEGELDAAIGRLSSAALLVARALLYWNSGRPQQALESLEAASRLDPREPSAYRLGAEIQSEAGNLPAMRQLIGRALALNAQDAEAIGLAAEAEFKGGRLEPALRLAEGALSRDPRESRALEVHALALAQLGRLAEARNSFRRVIDAMPEASTPRVNLGVFELQQGNASVAASAFKDAVDLDPSNLGGYRGLKEAAALLRRDDLVRFADRGIARLSGSRSPD